MKTFETGCVLCCVKENKYLLEELMTCDWFVQSILTMQAAYTAFSGDSDMM